MFTRFLKRTLSDFIRPRDIRRFIVVNHCRERSTVGKMKSNNWSLPRQLQPNQCDFIYVLHVLFRSARRHFLLSFSVEFGAALVSIQCFPNEFLTESLANLISISICA